MATPLGALVALPTYDWLKASRENLRPVPPAERKAHQWFTIVSA
jgi:hypothetical protein